MTKIIPTTRSFKKPFSYGERINPTRDWHAVLSIALVLFLLGVAWNAFLFYELAQGKNLGATLTPPQEVVGNSIDSVQALFQQRATEEQNYQSSYHFVDPSAPGS
jgi:hypothetical protein